MRPVERRAVMLVPAVLAGGIAFGILDRLLASSPALAKTGSNVSNLWVVGACAGAGRVL
jgi:hypothetical protein